MAGLGTGFFLGAPSIKSATYKEQTYQLIRDAILNHDLKEGVIYSQDQLGSELSISRTPVREALMELQKEGYISFLRGRGFEVVALTKADRTEILEFRMIVEKAACSLAAQRITNTVLRALEQNIKEQLSDETLENDQALLSLDESFHRMIWSASNNQQLVRATDNLRNQLIRSGYEVLFNNSANRQCVVLEHKAIFEALCARDPEAATRAMDNHLTRTFERLGHAGVSTDSKGSLTV